MLRTWLPRFIECLAIDALHPLIRVGYGIEQEIDEEIAAGLAYWAAAFRSGAPIVSAPIAGEAVDLFAKLRDTRELTGIKFSSASFAARLQQIGNEPRFGEVSGWRNPNIDLQALAREAARIYLSTHNFFALHMVTGAHAIGMLVPYVDDQQLLLDRGWQALAATYLIIGTPRYSFVQRDVVVPSFVLPSLVLPSLVLPSNAQLVEATLRVKYDNEHAIKLAHSAREAFALWQMPEHAMILADLARGVPHTA